MFGRRKPTVLNNDPAISDDTKQNVIVALLEIKRVIKTLLDSLQDSEKEVLGKWISDNGTKLAMSAMTSMMSGGSLESMDIGSLAKNLTENSPFTRDVIKALVTDGRTS